MTGYKARVKFEGKEWLVIDSFSLNEKKYMYLVTDLKENIKNAEDLNKYKDKIELIFIENTEGVNYKIVTDQNLINELSMMVAKRATME